jgi:hypothetical protein
MIQPPWAGIITSRDFLPLLLALRFDILSKLRPGGTLVLNTVYTELHKLEKFLPVQVS